MNEVTVTEAHTNVIVENDVVTVELVNDTHTVVVQLTEGGPQGPGGVGVAAGGVEGDLLVRTAGPPYSTAWTSQPKVNKLAFDLDAEHGVVPGQMVWDDDQHTLCLGSTGVDYHIGQDLHYPCKNVSSDPIPTGEALMFMGSDPVSGYLEVAHMIADGSVPGNTFFGVSAGPIPVGEVGFVTTVGKIRDIDTSAFPQNSLLWLDPLVPGGFTLSEPEAPNLKILVAVVMKSHPTEGMLFVRAETGRTIAQCHDVEIGLGAQDRQYLGWNEMHQHWMPLDVPNAAPRSITIAYPQAGDTFTLFRTDRSTEISAINALVQGSSSPAVTYELRYAASRSATGTLASSSTTASNTTTGSSAPVVNQPIPTNSYVWLQITAVTGTVNEFNLSISF